MAPTRMETENHLFTCPAGQQCAVICLPCVKATRHGGYVRGCDILACLIVRTDQRGWQDGSAGEALTCKHGDLSYILELLHENIGRGGDGL